MLFSMFDVADQEADFSGPGLSLAFTQIFCKRFTQCFTGWQLKRVISFPCKQYFGVVIAIKCKILLIKSLRAEYLCIKQMIRAG